jgi:hypothetical protein
MSGGHASLCPPYGLGYDAVNSWRNPMSSLASKQGPRYRHTAGEEEAYETIGVEKLTPIIGAEISGADLGALSNRQMDEIHRALAENCVIFFRDQHITPQQHLAFGRKFGELHIHPAAPHEGDDPALMRIYADKNSPRANGEGWHTDVSCDEEPPMGSILYIKQCPPRGGDTLFASMYAAYESLSDRMKAYLDGAHPSGDEPQGAVRQPRLHQPHRRPAARRKRRDPRVSLSALREPAVPVPLPLDRERDRVLGQSLHAASRDVGLLAAHALRYARHGEGRAAGVICLSAVRGIGIRGGEALGTV